MKYFIFAWVILFDMLLFPQNIQCIQTKSTNYTVDDGLSQSTVTSILQDDFGQMWFGTRNGLNLFNGYEFETFLHSPVDSNSIINNEITALFQLDSTHLLIGTRDGICKFNLLTRNSYRYNYKDLGYNEFVVNTIFKDKHGRIWVGTREGLFVFHKEINNFEKYDNINYPTGSVHSIAEDKLNNIWLGTNNGLFILGKNKEWTIIKDYLYNATGAIENHIQCLCFDRYDNLWAGTRNNGVFAISGNNRERIKHFTTESPVQHRLVSNEIRDILEDKYGRVWIGTKGGVNVYNPFQDNIDLIKSRISKLNSISQNSIYSLLEDKTGGIWVGTWSGGVNLVEPNYKGFIPITYFLDGEDSGPIRAVSSITACNGLLYVGTENNGLLIMDKNWNVIKTINTKNSNNKLRSDHIKKVYKDLSGKIWIGFYDRGMQIYLPTGGKIIDQIDNINVYDIKEYPKNVFFVASRKQFFVIDLNTNEIKTIKYSGEQESTNSQAGAILLIDHNKILWAGSRFGLNAYNLKTEKLVLHFGLTDMPHGTNSMQIFSLAEDNDSTLWIGTNQGLYYLNNKSFPPNKILSTAIKQDIIYGIIPYNDKLWISTNNGIIQYKEKEDKVTKYGLKDGLQSNEFIRNSYYNWNGNYLLFGGINGFNAFKPDLEIKNNSNMPILITKMGYTKKSGKISANINFPGRVSKNYIELPPNQPKIIFDFVCLDYFSTNNITYSYKLEGLDNKWVNTGNRRKVGFTKLPPGRYTFWVRAQNNGDIISQEDYVHFKVGRVYYATNLAFLIYFLTTAVIVILILKFFSQKRRVQNELKIEKIELEKLSQLNELKTKFYMNISHEFRTPLTVIYGPIERIVESGDYTLNHDEALTMLRNSKRLIELLDQLLELRKVEQGKSKMHVELIDIKMFVNDVVQLFRTIAYEKNISIELIMLRPVNLWADRDKLEKILSNLLSNAIKFTPEQGKILVEITENQDPLNEEGNVEISVIDNGIGMSKKEIERIFDRYETLENKAYNPKGIGIGLSLVKELVNLHHGDIRVDSEINKGAAFTIILPKGKSHFTDDVEFAEEAILYPTDTDTQDTDEINMKEKPVILVVDDNRDIRKYISGILIDYNIYEANSVEDAMTMIEGHLPDLIISDIILPGIDGFEFCKQIKSNQHTSHIPVIMMTAKSNADNRLHGLELGADAFISKPFSARILKVWVAKLINAQRKMFDYYMSQILFNNSKESYKPSLKDSFLETAKKIIEKDITNPELSVEMLSKRMNMSRSNLHLKFKAIINQTPSDFIRIIRLNHAAQLLISGNYNIIEAAYGSGFNSPSYFTKCFKQYFHKTPSEFVEKAKSI